MPNQIVSCLEDRVQYQASIERQQHDFKRQRKNVGEKCPQRDRRKVGGSVAADLQNFLELRAKPAKGHTDDEMPEFHVGFRGTSAPQPERHPAAAEQTKRSTASREL